MKLLQQLYNEQQEIEGKLTNAQFRLTLLIIAIIRHGGEIPILNDEDVNIDDVDFTKIGISTGLKSTRIVNQVTNETIKLFKDLPLKNQP
jgi:hypothetical protein